MVIRIFFHILLQRPARKSHARRLGFQQRLRQLHRAAVRGERIHFDICAVVQPPDPKRRLRGGDLISVPHAAKDSPQRRIPDIVYRRYAKMARRCGRKELWSVRLSLRYGKL